MGRGWNNNTQLILIMKKTILLTAILSMAATMLLMPTQATAQDRGPGRGGFDRRNFDPERMRERIMERYREEFEVKDDAEWEVIEERVAAVMEARREANMGGGFGRLFGRGPGGRGPGGPGPRDDDRGERRRFGPEPAPEVEALEKAVESNASADQLKEAMAKVREAREAKEANLDKAQDDLRKLLSVRQEAKAILLGLLD